MDNANAPAPGGVLRRGHGLPLDHIALAVPDTPAGVDHVHALTGARPHLAPPEPGQWYWSAGLALAHDSFLEIIGPNPAHRGIHPLKSIIRRFTEPRLLFWYLATDDFEAFAARVRAMGWDLTRIEHVGSADDTAHSHYSRALIGKGFLSQRPAVIRWRRRVRRETGAPACRLLAFELAHPAPAEINRLFERLDLGLRCAEGDSRLAIRLSCPKGEIDIASPGYELSLAGMAKAILADWLTPSRPAARPQS